jgi:zinc transport system substrate-binding protein
MAPATSVPAAAVRQGEPLPVHVTLPPQAYLARRIGGEYVAVRTLVRVGQDPHTFEPTPRQVLALGNSRLYFKVGIGMPFEEALLAKIRAQNPRLVVIDTSRGIPRDAILSGGCVYADADHPCEDDHEHEQEHSHKHGDAHGHGAGQSDSHIWLSPPLLKIQAANMAAALEEADPAHAGDYRANLAALVRDVDKVDRSIAAAMAPYRGQSFYVYHAAFGYFGAAYGLKQEAVEVGGRSPTPRQLRALIHQAKAENVKIILLQPQLDRRGARAVASALGGTVVTIDPLAEDVLGNLQSIAAEIRKGLE